MAWPPSWTIPASKVTRVRRLGFWNSIASVRPVSGGFAWRRVARYSALSVVAVSNTCPTSAADRSATLSRSRPRSDTAVTADPLFELVLRSAGPLFELVARSADQGRSGEGEREHESERTARCVSERAERPTHAWASLAGAVD